MAKALKLMKEELKHVDSIIYVLDARAPLSSINNQFEDIIKGKTVLYVLNKCDTVNESDIMAWQKKFIQSGQRCLIYNSTAKGNANKVINALIESNKPIIDRYLNKGVKKTIRAMVVGVPNCGKSTLINNIIGKKRVTTGNRPGVTRGKQWVTVSPQLEILDTPGTLYPDFSNQHKAINLAIIGSIKDDILDIRELCEEILKFLSNNYPETLMGRYNLISISDDMNKVMEDIAEKRRYVLKGSEYDIERVARAVVLDFRKQEFGKIILEKVDESTD